MSGRPVPALSEARPRRWPWLTVGMAIVVVLAAGWIFRFTEDPAARATDPDPSGWMVYRAADGAYSVVGPADPSVQTSTTDIGTERAVRFDAPAGELLGVESIDLLAGIAAGATEQDLVAAWANRVLDTMDGVIDEQDILRAGAHPGVALRVEGGNRTILLRSSPRARTSTR